MINAKQINILSETEVPFDVESGFGSNYNIDLSPNGSMKDVTELIEDDNYIISTAKKGDVYTKNNVTHRYSRNDFVHDEIGSKYLRSFSPIQSTQIPGYTTKTFERDVLALVWNTDNDVTTFRPLYTGDAYCIKTLSISRGTYYGNDCYNVDMYAKSLTDNVYDNYNICIFTPMYQYNNSCIFDPNSHSLLYNESGGYGYNHSSEANSIICDQTQLSTRIVDLFTHLSASGASYNNIRNYIYEQMPYGGIIIEPWSSFYVYTGGYYQSISDSNYNVVFSRTINPVQQSHYYGYRYPIGDGGKSWIIPFNSEEEYHAACCTKEVFTFSPY